MKIYKKKKKNLELYSGILRPYSDVLRPYSGVLELEVHELEFCALFFFFLSIIAPYL